MSSDTEIAYQFIAFSLRWLVGALWNNPIIVLLFLLSLLLLRLSWKLVNSSAWPPPILCSSWTSLTSLVLVVGLSARVYVANNTIVNVQHELDNALWQVKQGADHRIDLLNQMEIQKRNSNETDNLDTEAKNPLDGCLHIFIDLGSNRGLQIRKLYEPHTFPLAPILPLYEKYFGKPEDRNLQEICSVSFEPNSQHAVHLRKLSESYSTCGINMLVMQAGVGHRNTKSKFAAFDQLLGVEIGHAAGARLIHEDDGESVEGFAKSHYHDTNPEVEEVEVVRFARFITDVVATRKLPTSAKVTKPNVVIKADIEGAELKILPDMIMTGALQHVDNLHMEWHGESSYRTGREPKMIDKLEKAIVAIAELTESEGLENKFEIIEMDDETYSGLLVYKPWGDYSEIPMMTC